MKVQVRKRIKDIVFFIILLCSAIALVISPEQMNLNAVGTHGIRATVMLFRMELESVEIEHILAFILLNFLYKKYLSLKKENISISALIVSLILSSFLIIGMSFASFHDFSFIIGRKAQIPIAGIVFIGSWAILYALIKSFYQFLDDYGTVYLKKETKNKCLQYIDDHFVIVCIITLLVLWAVQALPFFPGSVPHDGRFQLNQYYGYTELNLHHPYYATMLMGTIYNIGRQLFGIIGGCLFYVVFQSVCAAIVFTKVCDYIRLKTNNVSIALAVVAFYAIAPMWWTYLQTIDKDAIYFISFTWFVLEYIKVFLDDERKTTTYIQMIVAGVCCCLFRNDAKYIIMASMIVLIFIVANNRLKVVFVSACIVIGYLCANAVPVKVLGLTSVNQVEGLGIPLQQVARYVTYCEDDLTEEEKEIIDNVIKYEGIPERYDPEYVDPIKNYYRDTTAEEFDEFFKLWLEKLCERPDICVTATWNNIYGYTDPFYFYNGLSSFQLYTRGNFTETDKNAVYSEYIFSDEIRAVCGDLVYSWQKVPGLSLVVNPGVYTWIGFILLGAVMRKKKWRSMMTFCIPVLSTAVCFASPVNGLLRYSLPIMAIVPMYLLITLLPYIEENKEKSNG